MSQSFAAVLYVLICVTVCTDSGDFAQRVCQTRRPANKDWTIIKRRVGPGDPRCNAIQFSDLEERRRPVQRLAPRKKAAGGEQAV